MGTKRPGLDARPVNGGVCPLCLPAKLCSRPGPCRHWGFYQCWGGQRITDWAFLPGQAAGVLGFSQVSPLPLATSSTSCWLVSWAKQVRSWWPATRPRACQAWALCDSSQPTLLGPWWGLARSPRVSRESWARDLFLSLLGLACSWNAALLSLTPMGSNLGRRKAGPPSSGLTQVPAQRGLALVPQAAQGQNHGGLGP